jgi:hypothetical protein
MFMFRFIFALNAAVLIGFGPQRNMADFARVNDVNGSRADYLISAVDGHKPLRDSAAFVQMVPVVLVKPGHHKFTLQPRHGGTGPREIQADIQAGTEYQITENQAGDLKLIPTTP